MCGMVRNVGFTTFRTVSTIEISVLRNLRNVRNVLRGVYTREGINLAVFTDTLSRVAPITFRSFRSFRTVLKQLGLLVRNGGI